MTEKHFVDNLGKYLGGFVGVEPPEGAIEVPFAPDDARQIWGGSEWGAVPVTVPETVTPRQARLALIAAGLDDDVDAYFAAQPKAVQVAWEFATEYHRDDPIISAAAAAIGLTGQQVDDLFIQAAAL